MGLILTIFLILSFVKKLRKMSTISLTTSEAIIIWIFYKSDSRILTHEELSNKIIDFYNKNEMKKAVDLDTPLNNLINLKCITINSENSEYILNEKVIMK